MKLLTKHGVLGALLTAFFVTAACGQTDDVATTAGTDEPMAAQPAPETAQPAAQPARTAEPATAETAEPVDDASAEERIELAQIDFSAVEEAGFVEGRNYRRLSPTQPVATSPGTVEVAEFFMYSCPHCNTLEPYVEAWLEDKPAFIEFVRIPTTWNPTVKLHAQAFYTAQALGLLEEMHGAFFDEMHQNNNFLQTTDALADFFADFGVSEEQFEETFESFGVMSAVNGAEELGRRYRVDATPTIVVNGKYSTGVDMAGGYDRLFELVELLAAAELGE